MPGKEKFVGERLNSIGTDSLKGAVAGERGSSWFVLKDGTRGTVNANTIAILYPGRVRYDWAGVCRWGYVRGAEGEDKPGREPPGEPLPADSGLIAIPSLPFRGDVLELFFPLRLLGHAVQLFCLPLRPQRRYCHHLDTCWRLFIERRNRRLAIPATHEALKVIVI